MDEREPQLTSQTDQRLEHRWLFLRPIRRRIARGDSYVLVLGRAILGQVFLVTAVARAVSLLGTEAGGTGGER